MAANNGANMAKTRKPRGKSQNEFIITYDDGARDDNDNYFMRYELLGDKKEALGRVSALISSGMTEVKIFRATRLEFEIVAVAKTVKADPTPVANP
ncbi:MAG: hypothetical protein ABH877_00130 [bacterium]